MNNEYNDLLIENMKLKDKLEQQRKEYQETYKDVREEIKDYKHQLEEKQKIIDDIKEYCKDDNEYWGNEDYTIGKNEENKKVRNDILEILERESEE